MRDLFVSHASADAALAQQIVAALEHNGVTCWLAPRDITPSADYRSEILAGLEQSDALLLIHTAAAAKSEHVARELGLADEANKAIYPLMVEKGGADSPIRYVLQGKQWIDFDANHDAAIRKLSEQVLGARAQGFRPFQWKLPPTRRAQLARLAIGAAAVAGLIALGVFLGAPAYARWKAVEDCNRLATSTLELDTTDGVLLGYVNPREAIPACTAAVAAQPQSARLRYQLMRAWLGVGGLDSEETTANIRQAALMGHPEAAFGFTPEPEDQAALAERRRDILEQLRQRDLANDDRALRLFLTAMQAATADAADFTASGQDAAFGALEQEIGWTGVAAALRAGIERAREQQTAQALEATAVDPVNGPAPPTTIPEADPFAQSLMQLEQASNGRELSALTGAEGLDENRRKALLTLFAAPRAAALSERGSVNATMILLGFDETARAMAEAGGLTLPARETLLERLAAAGDPRAEIERARGLLLRAQQLADGAVEAQGGETPHNLRQQGERALLQLSEAGYRPAMVMLAQIHLAGAAPNPSADVALTWLQRADGASAP